MNIIITGSLAYDRIMDFKDRFREHILPDKIHMLNVSFVVDKLDEKFGGTAGNIAYNCKLLNLEPNIVGAVGQDFKKYSDYLKKRKIKIDNIKVFDDEYTSVATMITDLDDNQISAFYPGAMKHGHDVLLSEEFDSNSFFVIAPSGQKEMSFRVQEAVGRDIPYLFDPGQQITALSGEELWEAASKSAVSIFNDYEWQLFREKTSKELDDLTKLDVVIIVTQGAQGSTIYTKEGDEQVGVAKPTKVVDPTGAGDAYRAGIIAGFVNKLDWKISCQLGATVASYAVEEYGTQEHNPSINDIKERYENNFEKDFPL
jgi:adenosine kinase